MIGVIDIGNTNFHCGKFENDSLSDEKTTKKTSEVSNFFSGIEEILCISVVPLKKDMIEETMDIDIISFPKDLVELDYQSEPGEDRLANGLGAKEQIDFPAIVVDCGSTITIDLFNRPTEPDFLVKFEGGAIMPGLNPYLVSVSKAGHLLPTIEPEFQESLGKNTKECIRFGAFGGLVGGIKEILRILDYKSKNLIFTGGDGKFFSKYFDAKYDGALTLKGGLIAYNQIS